MTETVPIELLPPQNLEAERCVLGAGLIDRHALEKCATMLNPRMFYARPHQVIFRAMLDILPGAVDLVTVTNALRDREALEAVGGIEYVMQLADAVPTTANAEHYAAIVYDKALRRGLLFAARDLERWAFDETTPTPEVLTQSEARVMALSEQRAVDVPDMPEALDELSAYLLAGRALRHPFYLETMTRYQAGGMMPGYFTLIGADPGIGKTRFLIREAYHQAQMGVGVLIFSLEINRPEMLASMVALELEINRDSLGCPEDLVYDPLVITPYDAPYQGAAERVSQWPVWVYDEALDADNLEAVVRRQVRKHPEIQIVMVDYAGLIQAHGRRGPERMEDVSAALCAMFKGTGLAGLVLCHISRDNGEVNPWYSRKLKQDCQAFYWIDPPGDSLEDVQNDRAFKFHNVKNRYARRSRDVLNIGWDDAMGFFTDMPEGKRGAGM